MGVAFYFMLVAASAFRLETVFCAGHPNNQVDGCFLLLYVGRSISFLDWKLSLCRAPQRVRPSHIAYYQRMVWFANYLVGVTSLSPRNYFIKRLRYCQTKFLCTVFFRLWLGELMMARSIWDWALRLTYYLFVCLFWRFPVFWWFWIKEDCFVLGK